MTTRYFHGTPTLAAGQVSMTRTGASVDTLATVRCVACHTVFVGDIEHVHHQFTNHRCEVKS